LWSCSFLEVFAADNEDYTACLIVSVFALEKKGHEGEKGRGGDGNMQGDTFFD
jgi:hypothetical protein